MLTESCYAHEGHRFLVLVEDGKLIAQGVNTEQPIRFNEQPVRPYRNVLHDHWTNYGFNGVDTAIAYLPGFDVPASEQQLWYSALNLDVSRVYRWSGIPESPDASTKPVFTTPLTAEFQMILNQYIVSSGALPGKLQLTKYIAKTGALDLDLRYELKQRVIDSIDVIEARLSTTADNVADSDTIYIILGPPGYKYQKTLMFLEQYLSENQPKVLVKPPAEKLSMPEFIKINLISILAVLSFAVIILLLLVRRALFRRKQHKKEVAK